ncbi:hypothetical protein SLE2022_174640 [Rubroshorea leprosula]
MKFGKEFASQMVPEWQEAYMDYDFLKTLLKEVQRFKLRSRPPATPGGLKRKMTLYRAFSGLTQRQQNHPSPSSNDIESQAILVNPVNGEGSEKYQTTFLMADDEGGEYELVYFRRLDEELNKVDKFYKAKVQEVVKEAEILNKQMEALIAFRIKVENPQGWLWEESSGDLTRLASDVAASAAALAASTPSGARANRRVNHMEVIEEGLTSHEHSDEDKDEKDNENSLEENVEAPKQGKILKCKKPAPLQILNHVKMNNSLETPRSTIKGVLNVPNHTELKFTRQNLRKVEEQLRRAFIEFYQKLRLLKSYRTACVILFLLQVRLPDFFLADQFTSQVQAFRSLEFYICYYGWGDFKHRLNTCKSSDVFKAFNIIVALIPYWSRFLQCLRRLYEEKDPLQGYNGLKYLVTILAVCFRTVGYTLNKGLTWKVLAWIFSVIAAVVGTYWDLIYDWGLLQLHSKNKWLRDKLLLPQKKIYFIAMALNVLLRFAWLQTVLGFTLFSLHTQTMITLVACLEIIRRGIWNFFRLENEHLNNVGKYRAFKSVPLPFNYDEDEDKDE